MVMAESSHSDASTEFAVRDHPVVESRFRSQTTLPPAASASSMLKSTRQIAQSPLGTFNSVKMSCAA